MVYRFWEQQQKLQKKKTSFGKKVVRKKKSLSSKDGAFDVFITTIHQPPKACFVSQQPCQKSYNPTSARRATHIAHIRQPQKTRCPRLRFPHDTCDLKKPRYGPRLGTVNKYTLSRSRCAGGNNGLVLGHGLAFGHSTPPSPPHSPFDSRGNTKETKTNESMFHKIKHS